jgi:hypothetical protein
MISAYGTVLKLTVAFDALCHQLGCSPQSAGKKCDKGLRALLSFGPPLLFSRLVVRAV